MSNIWVPNVARETCGHMDFQDARYKIVTSWVVIVNCYIIHSVLEWAVCTTSINRWFIIVAKELYRHSVWVYQPGVLYSLKRIPSRDTGTAVLKVPIHTIQGVLATIGIAYILGS